MTTEYRTEEQLNKIVESMANGNISQASQQCVDYGFYASDLISMCEDSYYNHSLDWSDFLVLIEMATEIRCKNDN